ncbi:MAG: NAD(P)H:quinone oxidoreductase [Trueperaceae bacterium]
MEKVKIAVIYYSATGTTHQLAKGIEEGAKNAGAEVRLCKVRELAPEEAIASNAGWSQHRLETQNVSEATLDDLRWADAIVLGTPTRYGLPSAQLKHFIDMTGPLWGNGELINKIVSSFTSAATLHGGHETTLMALNNTFYHWGSIIVSPAYATASQFQAGNPYGTSFTSNNGELEPDETALTAARFQGQRVAEIAQQFVAGRTPRSSEQKSEADYAVSR